MKYPLENRGRIGSPQHPRIAESTVAKVLADSPAPACLVAIETPAVDAVRTMIGQAAEALIVMDESRPAGIFSAREFARAMADGLDSRQPVSAMMTACAIHAAPEDTVDQCLSRMTDTGLRYLPVLENGKAVGVLSLESLLREIADHHARVYEASEVDHRIMFLRGTYSC